MVTFSAFRSLSKCANHGVRLSNAGHFLIFPHIDRFGQGCTKHRQQMSGELAGNSSHAAETGNAPHQASIRSPTMTCKQRCRFATMLYFFDQNSPHARSFSW